MNRAILIAGAILAISVLATGTIVPNAFASFNVVEIINSTGDGSNTLDQPEAIAVDSSGNVFVTGRTTDNAFKITPGGVITEIINSTGDGSNTLDRPWGIAVDSSDNVFVAGVSSDNAFKITPGGTLDDSDFFGISVANIGDLDGNGVNDLAVGANLDDDGGSDRGAVWILFMHLTIPCIPPVSDLWVITDSCEISSDIIAPASVIIQNDSVVTVNSGGSLTILSGENIIIVNGSGLNLIQGSNLQVNS